MSIKKVLLATIFLTFPLSLFPIPPLHHSRYTSDADVWISSFVGNASNPHVITSAHDLEIILNLLYFSYLRSYITLQAQEKALEALESTWHGWQNIAQTRMNPSHEAPYFVSLSEQKHIFDQFITFEQKHQEMCNTYDLATEHILKEVTYENSQSIEAIKIVRKRSREVILQAFLDLQKTLGELLNFSLDYVKTPQQLTEEYTSRFDVFNLISQHIPQAALQSFLKIEKLYKKSSQETWKVLSTIQTVSKKLWDGIEQERAAYYLAHYKALYNIMRIRFPDHLSMLYDANGFITTKQREQLPDLASS